MKLPSIARSTSSSSTPSRPRLTSYQVGVLENRTKVLLILSQDVVDRARIVAGKATITLKLPVSLQIVLRALIREGLK